MANHGKFLTGPFIEQTIRRSMRLLLSPKSPRPKCASPARIRSSSQAGSVMVEMALVLPIFFTLVFGTIEVAVMLYDYGAATYSCRAASRYASLHSNTSGDPTTQAGIESVVKSNIILLNAGTPSVLLYYGDRRSGGIGSNVVGDLVGVGVVWAENIPWKPGGGQLYLYSESYRVISR